MEEVLINEYKDVTDSRTNIAAQSSSIMIGTRLHISYVVDETIFDAGINVANG
jgi:hypothetical protein